MESEPRQAGGDKRGNGHMEPTAGKIFGLIGGAVRVAAQTALVPAPAGMPAWRPATHKGFAASRGGQAGQ
jgi:hypothetical protein